MDERRDEVVGTTSKKRRKVDADQQEGDRDGDIEMLDNNNENENGDDDGDGDGEPTDPLVSSPFILDASTATAYDIVTIIRKKIVFAKRPIPIVPSHLKGIGSVAGGASAGGGGAGGAGVAGEQESLGSQSLS